MGTKNTEPRLGDLVCWYSRKRQEEVSFGLVLTLNKKQRLSDVWWTDYITTCEWEDLEIINESNII